MANEGYEDRELSCVEDICGHEKFIVTAGEQEFFAGKGFELPKRCKACRERKKNRANSPFGEVAREYDKKYKGNDGYKNNRRHGREKIDDYEGQ